MVPVLISFNCCGHANDVGARLKRGANLKGGEKEKKVQNAFCEVFCLQMRLGKNRDGS